MKTNTILISTAIMLLINALTRINAYCQESYINDRWNIKAGYARYKTGRMSDGKEKTTGNYRIEANYGILKYIETGVYLGCSNFEIGNYNQADSSITINNYFTPFYGVNLNFHLLPFIVRRNNFRFDLYLTSKLGGVYFSVPENSTLHGHNTEYAIGVGLCFFIWDHIGLYTEYCLGNFIFEDSFSNDHMKFRYGLTFKFK